MIVRFGQESRRPHIGPKLETIFSVISVWPKTPQAESVDPVFVDDGIVHVMEQVVVGLAIRTPLRVEPCGQ